MTEQGREEEVQAVPSRVRRRRWPLLAGGGVIVVAGALALVALDRPASNPSGLVATEADGAMPVAAVDPLRAELLRCRTLRPGVDDPGCRAAWDESRRRFFGERGGEPVATPSTTPTPSVAAVSPLAPAAER